MREQEIPCCVNVRCPFQNHLMEGFCSKGSEPHPSECRDFIPVGGFRRTGDYSSRPGPLNRGIAESPLETAEHRGKESV